MDFIPLTVIAKLEGLTRQAIWARYKEGKYEGAIKLGRDILVPTSSVQKLLEARANG